RRDDADRRQLPGWIGRRLWRFWIRRRLRSAGHRPLSASLGPGVRQRLSQRRDELRQSAVRSRLARAGPRLPSVLERRVPVSVLPSAGPVLQLLRVAELHRAGGGALHFTATGSAAGWAHVHHLSAAVSA